MHTYIHRSTGNTRTPVNTYRYTCAHTDTNRSTCAPPTDTHPQLQGRWPGLASAGGAGLAPPSALGGLQWGWEFQGHPGRAGREFTSAPAAQAFVSLSVVSWVALVPGVSAHLRRGRHAAVRARRAAGAGGSPPEKSAYTGERGDVTGAVLLSHRSPCQPGRGDGGGTGHPGLLSAPLPASSPAARRLAPGPKLAVRVSTLLSWIKGNPTSSPQCVPLATVAMETACNLVNS